MLLPSQFFERNPGLDLLNLSVTVAFQPEIGSVGSPTYRGLLKFLSVGEIEAGFPQRGRSSSNSTLWNYHKFEEWTTTDLQSGAVYDHVYCYFAESEGVSAKDWVAAAQLAMHKQYQSLFDGFTSHMFEYTTAVIFWKTQSPWPSFRGFLYDWFLETTGALRGVGASLANPVSVVFDQKLHQLRLVNRMIKSFHNKPGRIGAGYAWVRLDGRLAERHEVVLHNGTSGKTRSISSVQSTLLGFESLTWPESCSSVCFLRVWPLGQSERTSWYWLTDWTTSRTTSWDYSALGQLRLRQSVDVTLGVYGCLQSSSQSFLRIDLGIRVASASESVLFYPSLAVWCDKRQLLPVFDDHASGVVVVPGQTQNRTLFVPARESLRCSKVLVVLDSWNAPSIRQYFYTPSSIME